MLKKYLLTASILLNGLLLVLYFMKDTDSKQQIERLAVERTGYVQHMRREPLSQAIDSVKAYAKKYPTMVRAYTISSTDILKVLGMNPIKYKDSCRYSSCRAYLALGTTDNFKLYLTPIKDNHDVFWFGKGRVDSTSTKQKENSFVLDLIAPCPKTCDLTSPLYTK